MKAKMKAKQPLSVVIIGKNGSDVEPLVRKVGFRLIKKGSAGDKPENKPDMVISFGGDGTLMFAEHLYPEVPKILLKDSLICKKCSALSNEEVLERVAAGKYRIEEMTKLEATVGGTTIVGMNDIIVHNADPRHAIRYLLSVDHRVVGPHIIGDGIVVATPFGSTAYYRSITDSFFEIGIGLAFNNSTEQSDHMVLRDESVISMKIIRGPVIVYADNQESAIDVAIGDTIDIKKSKRVARLVVPL